MKRIPLMGSERVPRPSFEAVRRADPNESIRMVIKVRPKNELPDPTELGAQLPTQKPAVPYEEHAAEYGARQEDIDAVVEFAQTHGLKVVEADPAQRLVVLTGAVKDAEAAFGTELHIFESKATGETYRGRMGPAQIPSPLHDIVTAVTGLDNRIQAKPQSNALRALRKANFINTSYTPPQLAEIYSFPSQLDGAGQCIGLLEFGGGYDLSDLKNYCKKVGVPVPPVTAVSVDGSQNRPGLSDADGEVMLDIEVVAGVAPGAKIAVYFAKFTESGWVEAITKAIHDTVNQPSIISISWGWAELEDAGTLAWTPQVMAEVDRTLKEAANLGITVIAAAGDDGSIDGFTDGRVHVDFPSSSQYVLGCGGTTLLAKNGKILSEVVWSDGIRDGGGGSTGGGASEVFPVPSWQKAPGVKVPPSVSTGFAGRGVPDVAANADARTGYLVRVDGSDGVSGGTSASAPLWAGLLARINQQLAKMPGAGRVGYFNPLLYNQLGPSSAFRDITSGTNDALGTLKGAYTAGVGWDACTGWGSPHGTNLLLALTGGAPKAGGNGSTSAPASVGSGRGPSLGSEEVNGAEGELEAERASNRKLVDTLYRLAQLVPLSEVERG
ncbi:MAG TPA: S53 family peptidase [Thermoanaerobaculia bacterium]